MNSSSNAWQDGPFLLQLAISEIKGGTDSDLHNWDLWWPLHLNYMGAMPGY
jgi:hypothetical protein